MKIESRNGKYDAYVSVKQKSDLIQQEYVIKVGVIEVSVKFQETYQTMFYDFKIRF